MQKEIAKLCKDNNIEIAQFATYHDVSSVGTNITPEELRPRLLNILNNFTKSCDWFKKSLAIDDDFANALKYIQLNKERNIWTVDKPMTVREIQSKIEECIDTLKMPLIVTLDHSVLVAKSSTEKDQFDTLHNLAKMMTNLKKYNVMFIVLTQLNREVESIERQKPGTYGNYIFDSDIYGGDALLQHADLVFGINRPSKYNIKTYGPEKYQVTSKHIVLHYLKNRNGQAGQFSFFEEDFEHMKLYEVDPPPRTIS
jgi:replicative DNA helicase